MRLLSVFLVLLTAASCDKESAAVIQTVAGPSDSVVTVPLRFISKDYIELNKIERISKFRSGIGHDYRDGAESCRSMKHYYQPKSGTAWNSVKIFSPVTGTVERTFEEWAGTQVWIRPALQPKFTVIIFHIALLKPLSANDSVAAGAQLGTHIGAQTMSDIAVGYSGGTSWQLLSYFSVMTDSLFASYSDRGVLSRDELIITKAARDADPLNCSGESFGSSGTLENWVVLH